MPPLSRRAFVLLIEDSDDDAFFFQWTIRKFAIDCDVRHIADGTEALAYLSGVARGENPRPDIVFVDLKLPGISGFGILEWAQSQRCEPPLPLVVLSGSEQGRDLQRAQNLGAAAYHAKPLSGATLHNLLFSVVGTRAASEAVAS